MAGSVSKSHTSSGKPCGPVTVVLRQYALSATPGEEDGKIRFIARRSFPALPSCVALATSNSRRLVSHSFRWCLDIRWSR